MKLFLIIASVLTFFSCASTTPTEQKSTPTETKKVSAKKEQKRPKHAPVIAASDYMTKQESELRKLAEGSDAVITRHRNMLVITLAGDTVFVANSYNPEAEAAAVLEKISPVLAHYDKTRISIMGYTDNAGKRETNQLLSEKRAEAVAGILEKSGDIADIRFWIEGKGSNDSMSGPTSQDKTKKNRVEIVLTPTIR